MSWGAQGTLPRDRRLWDLSVVCSPPKPIPVAQVSPWRGPLAPPGCSAAEDPRSTVIRGWLLFLT